ALQHLLLVPGGSFAGRLVSTAETQAQTFVAARDAAGPFGEWRHNRLVDDGGTSVAPIFPREEPVPGLEAGARFPQALDIVRNAGEREISDRYHMWIGIAGACVPAAIAEGVELLDIADLQRGLRRHPFAQADFKGPVRERIECAGRQAGGHFPLMR